jgi:hypothetical protein
MAEVTGSIGNEQVELNNAATEATLKALLGIARVDSKNLLELAKKVLGPNAQGLRDFEEALSENAELLDKDGKKLSAHTQGLDENLKRYTRLNAVIGQVDAVMSKLMSGTAQASDVFTAFSAMPGILGAVAQQFSKLAAIQEANFGAYQKMSNAGVSFSGSLTDLRLAAAHSYTTLDNFAKLMTTNSESFVRIGGTANDGAVAFSKFSNNVLGSKLGSNLMSLGYTADEANQAMVTYLAASGVSDTKELATNKKLQESTGQYLEELDRLAQVTGKSRQEQEETMKKLQLDAQVQMTAARMDPEARAKFNANVAYMTAQYGDAGKDMALAQAQGRSVITKEGATLTAMAPGMREAYQRMVEAGNKFGLGSAEYIKAQNEMSKATQDGFGKVNITALTLTKGLDKAQLTVADQMKAGLTSMAKFDERDAKYAAEKKKREESQAKTMADANKAFSELGAQLWEAFSPLISATTEVIGVLGQMAGYVASLAKEFPNVTKLLVGLGLVLATVVAARGARAAASAIGSAGSAAGDLLGNVGKAGGGIGDVLTGLARGLTAMANPVILGGALVLAGVIAILGAGVAVAMAAISLSLPLLANGFKSFNEVDGGNLLKVSLGIGALGLAMAGLGAGLAAGAIGGAFDRILTFATGGGTGGIAGFVNEISNSMAGLDINKLERFGDSLTNLSNAMTTYGKAVGTIDIAKAERVKELMKGPTAAEQIADAGAKVFSAAAERITAAVSGPGTEKSGSDLVALNSTMREVLKYLKDTAANTEKTAKEVSNSGYVKRA